MDEPGDRVDEFILAVIREQDRARRQGAGGLQREGRNFLHSEFFAPGMSRRARYCCQNSQKCNVQHSHLKSFSRLPRPSTSISIITALVVAPRHVGVDPTWRGPPSIFRAPCTQVALLARGRGVRLTVRAGHNVAANGAFAENCANWCLP